jgi:hypothetical protein
MACHYCQQMRQRMIARFRMTRFRPQRDPRKVAVAQPPQVQKSGGNSSGIRAASSSSAKAWPWIRP